MWPGGQGRWLSPGVLLLWDLICIQLWNPHHKKNIELLEWVRSRQWGLSKGWSTYPMKKSWDMRLLILEKIRLLEDLIAAIQYLKGASEKDWDFLKWNDRSRGNSLNRSKGHSAFHIAECLCLQKDIRAMLLLFCFCWIGLVVLVFHVRHFR